MLRPAAAGALAALALLAMGAFTPARASQQSDPAYTKKSAPYRERARFSVRYSGSGVWATIYHSEPPNQGGDHDTNDASDDSGQAWRIKFQHSVVIPACGRTGQDPDPCSSLAGLHGARGATFAGGRIDHRHVDGLYRELDMAERCTVRAATGAHDQVEAAIGLSYSAASKQIAVTAYEPVTTVLGMLPQACPGRGDSLDGLDDNYFTPGFSFDPSYTAADWFTSHTVVIPAAVFHRASEIRIPLRDTLGVTPPRDCAVRDPSIERCKTGGSWRGVLKFRAKP